MFDTLERRLTVQINKIFRSFEFNHYYCVKFKWAPTGMTLNLIRTEDIDKFKVELIVKHYGYESSSTGLDIYDDLLDYEVGKEEFTKEQNKFVLDYFKEKHPDIYQYFDV